MMTLEQIRQRNKAENAAAQHKAAEIGALDLFRQMYRTA